MFEDVRERLISFKHSRTILLASGTGVNNLRLNLDPRDPPFFSRVPIPCKRGCHKLVQQFLQQSVQQTFNIV